MRLHQNWDLFTDALQAASQPIKDGGLGIKSIFIERIIGYVAHWH